ncbi:MAG: hypothetical protein AAB430_04035 [Patescibacteria group bacterium]
MANEKEGFVQENELLINLLLHHAPNVVPLGVITSYLDASVNGVQSVVVRARGALKQKDHPLHGKAEIVTMNRVGYRLVLKE